jgi:hypothetical protein
VLQILRKRKKNSQMQGHKITCLRSLKQRISKKKFECKLAELQTFGGEKESPKRSLNASLQNYRSWRR